MMKFLITNRLHKGCIIEGESPRLISMQELSAKEIAFARKNAIRRYYLPSLSEKECAEFYKEFDTFWDQVIKPFDTDDPFWRNVVSSKMQGPGCSAAYLALMLFTLAKKEEKDSSCIVIVCSSLEEEDVCEEWGKKMGWEVYRKPYLLMSIWSRRIIQEIRNLKDFLRFFALCLYKKWFSPKYKPGISSKNNRVLIASLFYDNCFINGMYLDTFFGNLHNIIKQNGKSVTYLCGPLGNFRKCVKKVRGCSEVSILVPYSLITWTELILLGLRN